MPVSGASLQCGNHVSYLQVPPCSFWTLSKTPCCYPLQHFAAPGKSCARATLEGLRSLQTYWGQTWGVLGVGVVGAAVHHHMARHLPWPLPSVHTQGIRAGVPWQCKSFSVPALLALYYTFLTHPWMGCR
jgi:hypothetical protein